MRTRSTCRLSRCRTSIASSLAAREQHLINKIEGTNIVGIRMPFNRTPLPRPTIDVIRRWVLEGAKAA